MPPKKDAKKITEKAKKIVEVNFTKRTRTNWLDT